MSDISSSWIGEAGGLASHGPNAPTSVSGRLPCQTQGLPSVFPVRFICFLAEKSNCRSLNSTQLGVHIVFLVCVFSGFVFCCFVLFVVVFFPPSSCYF